MLIDIVVFSFVAALVIEIAVQGVESLILKFSKECMYSSNVTMYGYCWGKLSECRSMENVKY